LIAHRRVDRRATLVLLVSAFAFAAYASTHPSAAQSGTYGAIYAVAAIGLSVLLGNVNIVSLGNAGFFAVGAYAVAWLTTTAHWPLPAAMAAAIVLAAAAGIAVGVIALRFRGHHVAMATLAFGLIVTGVLHGDRTFGGGGGMQLGATPSIGPFPLSGVAGYTVAWMITSIVALLTLNLLRGRAGRAFEAIRNDELAADVLGVATRRYKVLAFTYSAALAGLAGGMYAVVLGVVVPDAVGVALSIDFVLMVVLGGRGYVAGAIAGATLIAVLAISGQQLENWREVAYGALVIVVVIVFPAGLIGVLRPRSSDDRAVPVVGAPALATFPQVAPSPSEPPLRLHGVTMRFGGLTAVDNVAFSLAPGTLTSLIGPNGAGKTTLFDTIATGTIAIRGTDVTGWRPHRIAALGVRRTFQSARLFDEMTVLENVIAGAFACGRTSLADDLVGSPHARIVERRALERARATLARFGMEPLADVVARDLPFAIRRRVELARALVSDPWLLLVDEPAAGLDANERAALRDDLLRIRASGVTMLLVEHDMRLVMSISDRVMALQFGRLIADGSAASVRNDPGVIAAYLGRGR